MSKVRADNISNRADDGAPALTYGAEIPVGIAITGAGNINVGGAATISGNINVGGAATISGNINVGGAATISGNLSVGGTLTYEDVTNIDSVGVITARSGTVSGIVTFLSLDDAQDHKLTISGISTISCTGGSEGDSHIVRIVNSGITTVGFSTFFLFPSGSTPSLPTADGAISLISFTVHRVGAAGTQLLAGASVNYS